MEPPRLVLVGPPVVAVVCRLVHLRLLLNGSVLAPLSGAALLGESDWISQTEAFHRWSLLRQLVKSAAKLMKRREPKKGIKRRGFSPSFQFKNKIEYLKKKKVL